MAGGAMKLVNLVTAVFEGIWTAECKGGKI